MPRKATKSTRQLESKITRQSSSDGSMKDYIYMMDIKQNDPATARVCQVDPSHGRLTVHGTGAGLICAHFEGIKDNKAVCCGYKEPLGR